MDYTAFSREELLHRVLELEAFVRELMHQHEEEYPLHQAWGRDLSHYYWNAQRDTVLLDPKRADVFGIDAEVLAEPVDTALVLERIHPEDREAVLADKVELVSGDRDRSEIEFRAQDASGAWRWYHDRAAISRRDEQGAPVVVSGLLFDITHFHAMQEELSAANERLTRRAETDGLTGIANHRTLVERLMQEPASVSPSTISVMGFASRSVPVSPRRRADRTPTSSAVRTCCCMRPKMPGVTEWLPETWRRHPDMGVCPGQVHAPGIKAISRPSPEKILGDVSVEGIAGRRTHY